jgi:flagellar biosynthesis/type III secretory pathway chaperone
MQQQDIRELLIRLRDTILAEREHARQLDLQAMMADTREKEHIIGILSQVEDLHPDDRKLAEEIKQENRRNAFFFRATLLWIQDTMVFFGRKSVPATYGKTGRTISSHINGRLLSGRI